MNSIKKIKLKFINNWQPMLSVVFLCIGALSSPQAQNAAFNGTNSCLPVFQASHVTTNCLQKDKNEIAYPTVSASCGNISKINYEDAYYELTSAGLAGYFALDRWEKKSGDGGVDVTGAPNCVLVEGANIARVTVAPGRTAILRIAIPARGYVTFGSESIGGSNLLFSAIVNNKVYPIKTKDFYRSPLLQAGDLFSFQMANTSKDQLSLQISDFEFFTNTIAVIKRHWTATDDLKNTATFDQFIDIQSLPLANVLFPENLDGQSAPLLQAGQTKEPSFTGFPVFDEDGNSLTTNDQHSLSQLDCAFSVEWKDEIANDANGTTLLRHWKVKDKNGNVREHTQLIRPQNVAAFNAQLNIQAPSVQAGDHKSSVISNDSTNKITVSKFNKKLQGGSQLMAAAANEKNNAPNLQ